MTRIVAALVAGTALASCGPTAASPGAHGPNGEHLDGPATSTLAGTLHPQLQAHSELFEIVGAVDATAFSFFVTRYDSNEPVMDAKVEVEFGTLKAAAPFDAATGAYAVNDPAFAAALARPGRHALVFTVTAGTLTDLLDGELSVATAAAAGSAAASGGAAGAVPTLAWAALGALGAAALVHTARRRRGAARATALDAAGGSR